MTSRTICSVSAVAALAMYASAGGPVSWADAVNGDWSDPARWSPAMVPGASDDVELGLTSSYSVSASQNHSALSLSIINPNATLDILGFRTLTMLGPISNSGTIRINPFSTGAGTALRFDTSASLSGSGSLVLAYVTSACRLETGPGAVITQMPGHTIEGRGWIEAAITNNGLVSANVTGGTMELRTEPKTNNASIEAVNGANMSIIADIDQGVDGRISADGAGSTVTLGAVDINGGVVEGVNDGRVIVNGNAMFDAVRTIGNTEVAGFRRLGITNDLVNDGLLAINPSLTGAASGIRFEDSSSLVGSGRLNLAYVTTTAELSTAAGATFTHGPNHTIDGRGRISASLINNGTISANFAGGTMEVFEADKTNNANMRAANGGTMLIRTTINQNSPGRLTADGPGSVVQLENAAVSGGVVESTNGGNVFINGNTTFDAVVFEGNADIAGFRTLSVSNTLVNNGLIRINPSQTGAATGMTFLDSSSLTGSGRMSLPGLGVLSEVRTATNETFTHDAGHTIDGRGRISASMVNNGTIRANVSGGVMEMTASLKTNNAVMRAESGGTLSVQTTINQGAGGSIAADGPGSRVALTGATINGGTIVSLNDGKFTLTNGDSTASGTDIQAEVEVEGFRTLRIGAGTLNNGTITVNPAQTGAATRMRWLSDFTLGGTGTIRLATNNSLAEIGGEAGVTLISLGQGQRLEGIGRVAAPLDMRGTIAPGLSVGTLNAIESITMTPTATFEAEVSLPETADKLASTSAFVADGTLDVRFVDGFNPGGYWGATIVTATQGVTGRFDTILAPVPADSRLAVRARYLPNEIRIGAVCKPDINFDGQLNFFDISAFISLYNIQDPDADVSAPFGVWNFFDIATYIAQYNAGCP